MKQSAEIHSKESHGDLEDDIEGEWIFYKKKIKFHELDEILYKCILKYY